MPTARLLPAQLGSTTMSVPTSETGPRAGPPPPLLAHTAPGCPILLSTPRRAAYLGPIPRNSKGPQRTQGGGGLTGSAPSLYLQACKGAGGASRVAWRAKPQMCCRLPSGNAESSLLCVPATSQHTSEAANGMGTCDEYQAPASARPSEAVLAIWGAIWWAEDLYLSPSLCLSQKPQKGH